MKSDFDIDRAKLLVGEISGNLAALPADSTKYAQLRAEVAEELRADGIRAGQFLGEIGRMLGLD